ncbi:MAG: hypothetical protein KKB37_06695 [Alphaproteobacteria bacterium]|nr:hypothetical protein [Alphaproteobacteria bacterium]
MYKGRDLDLRTLAAGEPKDAVEWRQAGGNARADSPRRFTRTFDGQTFQQAEGQHPIWVDKPVLVICNRAYELAALMGAFEVSLAHLLFALTQVEASASELRERSVDVDGLRREANAIILEEFRTISRAGKSEPRNSDEFDDVLKLAAGRAHGRRSPITTADLIDTMFEMSRENPTHKILHRHRTDFDLHDPAAAIDSAPGEGGRRKVRVSAGSNHIGDRPRVPNGVPSVTDIVQNSRMDAIERAIRELSEDMARNRTTFDELIGELRTGNSDAEAAFEVPRQHNGYVEYYPGEADDDGEIHRALGRLERNVDAKFRELARTWSVLGERLVALENTVVGFEAAGSTLEMTPEFEARLKTLSFADDRLDKLEGLLSALPQRLSEIEQRLEGVAGNKADTADVPRLLARLERIEDLLKDAPGGKVELGPVITGLRDVEAGLRGVGGQLREVDLRTGDVNLAIDDISERQQRLEDTLAVQQSQLGELIGVVREEVSQLGNALLGQSDGGERLQTLVENSLRGVSDNLESHGNSISASVNGAVSQRLAALNDQLHNRMSQIEELIRRTGERPVTAAANNDIDGAFLTDAVGRIVANQHTLAGSIDEWRAEVRDDLSAVKERIEQLENVPAAAPVLPNELFEEISEQLKHIQSTIPERQPVDGWSRFKIWLYGTTDWYGASWGGAGEADGAWQRQRAERAEDDRRSMPAGKGAFDNQSA